MIRQRFVDDLGDPGLEPFREIRNRNWTERSGWFIVEGPLLVESLLSSDYGCKSVLLDEKYESQRLEALLQSGREDLEIIRMEHALVQQLTGFDFHRGVLGCGLRRPRKPVTVSFESKPLSGRELVAFATGVQDPENLGSLLRSCAALGVRRVVIGEATADPFSRRAMRVAMGTTLSLDVCFSADSKNDLKWLRTHGGAGTVYGTSLREQAVFLDEVIRTGPGVVLFGNERHGLPEEVYPYVDQCLKIRMHNDVDSLNVGVASGVILHHLGTC